MATLTGKKPKNTYKDLLQVSNANAGIDGTLRSVEDGEGTASVLQLSTSALNINSATGLQLNGTTALASGLLKHEVGGLEADVSAFDGLVKISSGSTSAVSLSATGEGFLDSGSTAAAREYIGLTTVGQAEAEAGTATTTRAWTAQRVSQAISALSESSLPRGYISGFNVTNNGTDADHDLDISEGSARSSDDTVDVSTSSSFTKLMDASFVKGTGNGGLGDTVSLPTSGTLHVFAITEDSSGDVDFYGDTAFAGTNVPTGWTVRRRIDSVLTDGSANIIGRIVLELAGGGVEVRWTNPPLDIDVSDQGTSAVTRTLSVPSGFNVRVFVNGYATKSGADAPIYLRTPGIDDEAPSFTAAPLLNLYGPSGQNAGDQVYGIRTGTSAQITSRSNTTAVTLRLATIGYIDERRV